MVTARREGIRKRGKPRKRWTVEFEETGTIMWHTESRDRKD
jgi:hypothetical protein